MNNEELVKRIEELEYKVACQNKYIHENNNRIRILGDWIYRLEKGTGVYVMNSTEMPIFRKKNEELCKICKYHDCDHLCLYCSRYSSIDSTCKCDNCSICADYKEKEQLIVKKPAGKTEEG